MKKILLSLTFIMGCFLTSGTQALTTQNLKCQFHNSRKCAKPQHFESELNTGCASPAGNCRYVFCQSNCMKAVSDSTPFNLCKICLEPTLLARFSRQRRQALYETLKSSPTNQGSQKALALIRTLEKTEQNTLTVKQGRKKFWPKSQNTDLLNKLVLEQVDLENQSASTRLPIPAPRPVKRPPSIKPSPPPKMK